MKADQAVRKAVKLLTVARNDLVVHFSASESWRLILSLFTLAAAEVAGQLKGREHTARETPQGIERVVIPPVSRLSHIFLDTRAAHLLGEKLDRGVRALVQSNAELLTDAFGEAGFRKQFAKKPDALRLCLDHVVQLQALLKTAESTPEMLEQIFQELKKLYIKTLNPSNPGWIPPELAWLCASLLDLRTFETLNDPFCADGSLLFPAASLSRRPSFATESVFTGQESNSQLLGLARLSLAFFPRETDAVVASRDVLHHPYCDEAGDSLQRYSKIISNLSFGTPSRIAIEPENDPWGRYDAGSPTADCPDMLRLAHVASTLKDDGRAVLLVRQAILERGGADSLIRRKLIEDNLVDAVISLPKKVIPGAQTSSAILYLHRGRVDEGVLFIDGSAKFRPKKQQNLLTEAAIGEILSTYLARRLRTRSSRMVSARELERQDFSLAVPRYLGSTNAGGATTHRQIADSREPDQSLAEKLSSVSTRLDDSLQSLRDLIKS